LFALDVRAEKEDAAAAATEEFRLTEREDNNTLCKPDDQILSRVLIGVFGARWIQLL
jgi:hypothetical protein